MTIVPQRVNSIRILDTAHPKSRGLTVRRDRHNVYIIASGEDNKAVSIKLPITEMQGKMRRLDRLLKRDDL